MCGSLIAIVRSALLRRARADSLPSVLLEAKSLEEASNSKSLGERLRYMSFIQQALRASSPLGVAMAVDEQVRRSTSRIVRRLSTKNRVVVSPIGPVSSQSQPHARESGKSRAYEQLAALRTRAARERYRL